MKVGEVGIKYPLPHQSAYAERCEWKFESCTNMNHMKNRASVPSNVHRKFNVIFFWIELCRQCCPHPSKALCICTHPSPKVLPLLRLLQWGVFLREISVFPPPRKHHPMSASVPWRLKPYINPIFGRLSHYFTVSCPSITT